jgi:hypothetical protein
MDHPEQPSLPGIGDVQVGREGAAGGHADVARLADPAVDVVWDLLVVDQEVDGAPDANLRIEIDLVRAAAKAGAAKEVLDLLFSSSHAKAFLTPPPAIRRIPESDRGGPICTRRTDRLRPGVVEPIANGVPMRFGGHGPRRRRFPEGTPASGPPAARAAVTKP